MDLFQQACGASGPLHLSLAYQGSGRVEGLAFDTPFVVIGRDPGSDLVLNHREVSEQHAYLQLIEGRLLCVDLDSRSGTWLGDEPLRSGWVEPEDLIRIGPYRIRLVAGDGGPAGSLDDLPPLTLDLTHQGLDISECSIAGGLSLVGSAVGCPVRLLDPDVSTVHCSLLSTSLGVWAVDLLGEGGIQVNGIPVRHARLDEGDELQVGRSSIRVRSSREEGPPHETAAHETFDRGRDDDPGESVPFEEPGSFASEPDVLDDEALAALSARERRGSCRYPVADVDAALSWREPLSTSAVLMPVPEDETLSLAEKAVFSRVMARWAGDHQHGARPSRAGAGTMRDFSRPIDEAPRSCVRGARLVDISQTGVQVRTAAIPPDDQPIWFRLESPRTTEWVEVVLKGVTPEDDGTHRVRLAFREACPYDLFKIAVYSKKHP